MVEVVSIVLLSVSLGLLLYIPYLVQRTVGGGSWQLIMQLRAVYVLSQLVTTLIFFAWSVELLGWLRAILLAVIIYVALLGWRWFRSRSSK